MRKWWKDTNDPSGSFHSAVKEERAVSFSFPRPKVYGTAERFSGNLPASVAVNPPAAHGPWVPLVDQQRRCHELCPPNRMKLGVTNRKGKSRGSGEAVSVIPQWSAVPCRWNSNFHMGNTLQVILSFYSKKWGCKTRLLLLSLPEQWHRVWGQNLSSQPLQRGRQRSVLTIRAS